MQMGKREEMDDVIYKMRAIMHITGLQAERMATVRDTINNLLNKKDRTPEDIQECLTDIERMAENISKESAELSKSVKELKDRLTKTRYINV
jgi:septation ring formation regulator EzrA